MQDILNILFWAGTLAGGVLILLLLVSIFSGLEIGGGDVDVNVDTDTDAGASEGLGVIKTLLTFVSVGAFTGRAILLNTSWSWPLVIISALVSGIVAVIILGWFFRWLLKNQESGNWQMWQAEGKTGSVYVPIPADGKGRIVVQIDDVDREIAAKSEKGEPIGTHAKVFIVEAKEDYVIVSPFEQ
ncbi:MAG: hypothetical protein R2824_34460 [Saprospiraceae bacterium]|nr:hypothetical protein [Lewinella sp.]